MDCGKLLSKIQLLVFISFILDILVGGCFDGCCSFTADDWFCEVV